MDVNNKIIVVTGGFGFIGQHIIKKLLQFNVKRVIIIDSLDYGKKNDEFLQNSKVIFFHIRLGDISVNDLKQVIDGADYCIHLAAEKHNQSKHQPNNVLLQNVNGMNTLLTAAQMVGIKKIVFSSSLYVYGKTKENGFSEKDPCNPHTIYGISKLTGEYLLSYFSQNFNIDYVVLRYFFVYGPYQYQGMGYKSVIVKNFQRLLQGESPVIYGNGHQMLDYIYIDDVVNATILSLSDQFKNKCFNIGSNNGLSINQLLTVMMNVYGRSLESEYQAADETHGTFRFNKSRNAINEGILELTVDIKTGLKRTLDWIKTQ